jgi:hypothetical protein
VVLAFGCGLGDAVLECGGLPVKYKKNMWYKSLLTWLLEQWHIISKV